MVRWYVSKRLVEAFRGEQTRSVRLADLQVETRCRRDVRTRKLLVRDRFECSRVIRSSFELGVNIQPLYHTNATKAHAQNPACANGGVQHSLPCCRSHGQRRRSVGHFQRVSSSCPLSAFQTRLLLRQSAFGNNAHTPIANDQTLPQIPARHTDVSSTQMPPTWGPTIFWGPAANRASFSTGFLGRLRQVS